MASKENFQEEDSNSAQERLCRFNEEIEKNISDGESYSSLAFSFQDNRDASDEEKSYMAFDSSGEETNQNQATEEDDIENTNFFSNEEYFNNLLNSDNVQGEALETSAKESSSLVDFDDEYDSSDESDVPFDDIDDMLEQGLKGARSEGPTHQERKKIVLKKREQDYFDILPEGWIEVTHFSGMPVYLHKQTRVCTLAKPYYLGSGSVRKHEVPVSAIPCLAYRKELEKEKSAQGDSSEESRCPIIEGTSTENAEEPIASGSGLSGKTAEVNKPTFSAKVETVKDNKKERSLNYMQMRDYCRNVFEFQEITIRKFKTWADRRKHLQLRKMAQRPSLPEGTKLITCPLPKNKETPETQGRNLRKEFVMNPAGKSSVCILHEFVQHAERVQPKYVFKELENAATPYSATVMINSMQYGVGYGSSKKQAKSEAARATLEILIPDMKDLTQASKKLDTTTGDLSFFDEVKVEDPRVSELCTKAGQHSPYQILVECLRRNCGMGDTDITTNVRIVKHQKNEFTMKVGEHVATVICRNKREGKQRAAQAILQKLHPQITNWGSLLRLYGRGSCKTPKEKKEEEQRITELQNTASNNRPNYAILNKLREEMLKLKENPPQVIPFSGVLPSSSAAQPASIQSKHASK